MDKDKKEAPKKTATKTYKGKVTRPFKYKKKMYTEEFTTKDKRVFDDLINTKRIVANG